MGKRNLVIAILSGITLIFVGLVLAKNITQKPERITISLPYRPENPVKSILPMGETIEHDARTGGHPGIDFQWSNSVPLIAVADGEITYAGNPKHKENEYAVNLRVGQYDVYYTELAKIEQGIEKGVKVKKGDVIAYPGHFFEEHFQTHWEFKFANKLMSGRLCPLTYFDENSLQRIIKEWDNGKHASTQKIGKEFPYICSGSYKDKNE